MLFFYFSSSALPQLLQTTLLYHRPFFFSLSEYLSSKKTEHCSTWREHICHSSSCPQEKDNYSPFFILGIMAKQDWYLFWNDYSFIHKSCPENLVHFASPQAHYCRKCILNSLFFFFLSFNFGSSSRSFRFITRALFPILIFGKEKC